MVDGRIPKYLHYGEFGKARETEVVPSSDIGMSAKDDLKAWETIATDRDAWKHTLKYQLPKGGCK